MYIWDKIDRACGEGQAFIGGFREVFHRLLNISDVFSGDKPDNSNMKSSTKIIKVSSVRAIHVIVVFYVLEDNQKVLGRILSNKNKSISRNFNL